jgi:hypothetical protein
MAGRGAPVGNQHAAKGKQFTDTLRKLCVQDDYKKFTKAAQALLDAAANGEPWAIEQLANRVEGKPGQQIMVSGDADAPLQIVAIPLDSNL